MVCGRISSILCLLFLIFGLFFTDVLLNAQTTDRTNTQSGEILDPLSIPRSVIGSGLVRQVKFSPKGDEIAVTTTLGVEILNASNLSPLAFYSLKPGVSNAISYSTDGQKIAVVAGLETFVINRRANQIIQLKKAKQVQGVAFAPDDRLFTLLSDGIVQVWDSQQDLADFATAEPTKWHQHRYRPRAISFSPSGSYVATGAADRVISIRRLSDGQWMGNLSGAGLVNQIAFSMDESQLVASSLEGVRAWSAKTMQRTKKLHTKRTGSDYHLATDLNSSRFAIVSRTSGNCAIWDLMLEKKETEFQADIGTISATFHPQGKNFVTATPYSIKIWNPENGKVISSRDTYYRINNFGFSADSSQMILSTVSQISGEVFGELMLWDVVDNQLIHRWVAHQSEISTVRFSPDGTRILSRSITELNPENPKRSNQVLRMWSTDSFEQIGADLIANREQVNSSQLKDPTIIAPFDFNVEVEMLTDAYESGKDQTYIVMTDKQKMILWKAPKQFHFIQRSYWPVIYRQQISRAASNNGKHIVVVKNKDIEIDLGPGTPRPRLNEHRGNIKQMQFSFDSRYLASLAWDTGACVLWKFD